MRQANKLLRSNDLAYLTQGNNNTEKVFKFSLSAYIVGSRGASQLGGTF